MSQISGEESLRLGLITGDVDSNSVRPASYDLRIGTITIDGSESTISTKLQPQAVAILTSAETVEVKPGYIGYVFPKTSLCNEGIHVLNTGIVDPGFKGKLTTIALNFNGDPQLLAVGDPFLRVVFHPLESNKLDVSVGSLSDKALRKDVQKRSIKYPNSFLDMPEQLRKVTGDITQRSMNSLLFVLTIFTVIFAVFAYIGPSLSQFAPGYWEAVEQSNDETDRRLEELAQEMRGLTNQINGRVATDEEVSPETGSKKDVSKDASDENVPPILENEKS